MIATTINMHHETFSAISRAALRLVTTRRAIVVRLLMRIMHDVERHHGGFTTVRYQPHETVGEWHCFSIRFKPDENEFFTDLRKICKCSVSYLVAKAVSMYLDDMLNEMGEVVHKNVWFKNYIIQREVNDGIVCWRIAWGYGEKIARRLLERGLLKK